MKIGFFDCVGGASGDMIVSAMLDAGLELEFLRAQLASLGLDKEFSLEAKPVLRQGFKAMLFKVCINEELHGRNLRQISEIVDASCLPTEIKTQAKAIFRRMCEVEAGIHGSDAEEVHLHELGGVDTIVDVVSALLGMQALALEEIVVSPLPMGHGFVTGAHGQIPLPAPATVGLLGGAPVFGVDLAYESVTPTGAALLTHFATRFGRLPAMRLEKIGVGAGSKKGLPIPNVIRLLIGEKVAAADETTESIIEMQTNLDDVTPEVLAYTCERLLAAGALDAFLTPVVMKKGRPGQLLTVLCHAEQAAALRAIIFAETGTLGIRFSSKERSMQPRRPGEVETPLGRIQVKISGEKSSFTPEFESCRSIAKQRAMPLREVYRLAEGGDLVNPTE